MAKVPSVPGVPFYRETVPDGTGSKMVIPCAPCVPMLGGTVRDDTQKIKQIEQMEQENYSPSKKYLKKMSVVCSGKQALRLFSGFNDLLSTQTKKKQL